jgi:hypothetical protein
MLFINQVLLLKIDTPWRGKKKKYVRTGQKYVSTKNTKKITNTENIYVISI